MEYSSKVMAALGRLSAAACVIVLFAGAAVAYTIVKKDGRRIQIPAEFSVTHTTLTYEVSPGFQITMHLATIDVAATERANGEQPGTFLRRAIETTRQQAAQAAPASAEPPSTTSAQRTVSNRDLATYARKRKESEIAYERRRKELGLPSIEESRLRQEAEGESIWQDIQQRKEQEAESEAYWRGKASELRTELAAVDAEISYVRARIDQLSNSYTSQPYFVLPDQYPFGYGVYDPRYGTYDPRYRGRQSGRYGRRPYLEPGSGWPYRNRNRYRRSGRDQILINPGFPIGGGFAGPLNGSFRLSGGRSNVAPRRFRNHVDLGAQNLRFSGSFQDPYYQSPVLGYDAGYDSSLLLAKLDELLAKREALLARWREFEQEARRAGVPPGWLRP